ncbi:hypothetical protein FNV43_RR27251 [Rhamnella rubrinervis]|uniref:Uncharacterized protein n=1 Tax=Rhamnella rubrinervis TaxID=2594499 RepID=A0A8K0DPM3_9ROSA|nr:hypothetical protein FNV43_RR27251 [Rhamnella rubrinervis]
MSTVICWFLSNAPIHPLQVIGKGWQSLIGHIIMWFEAYKKFFVSGNWEGLPAAGSTYRVPRGLVKVGWPTVPTVGKKAAHKVISLKAKTVEKATKLATKVHLSNAGLWKLEKVSAEPLSAAKEGSFGPAVDPSVVDAIKNIKAGKRPTSEPASGGNTSKLRRMAGNFSKSATSSKSTSSIGVGADQTPTSRAAYQAMVTAHQLKNMKEEQSSSKKSFQALEGKCKTLEKSFTVKENERERERHARLQHHEEGSQDPPQVNEPAICPSKGKPPVENQSADEITEKAPETIMVEKTTEEEES